MKPTKQNILELLFCICIGALAGAIISELIIQYFS
jgi:uncharacterized membrane protein